MSKMTSGKTDRRWARAARTVLASTVTATVAMTLSIGASASAAPSPAVPCKGGVLPCHARALSAASDDRRTAVRPLQHQGVDPGPRLHLQQRVLGLRLPPRDALLRAIRSGARTDGAADRPPRDRSQQQTRRPLADTLRARPHPAPGGSGTAHWPRRPGVHEGRRRWALARRGHRADGGPPATATWTRCS